MRVAVNGVRRHADVEGAGFVAHGPERDDRMIRDFTLSQHRIRLLSKVSGGFLIGGGLWLASSRGS